MADKKSSALEQAISFVRRRMPDVANVPFAEMTEERPSSAPNRLVEAEYEPFGKKVNYSKRILDRTPEDLYGTVAHELTHARQYKDRGLFRRLYDALMGGAESNLPYNQRGEELEAFQAENDLRTELGLPGWHRTPSLFGETAHPYDIPLPKDRK